MFLLLDLFPNKVELHVKKSDKYRTSTGTVVTLVVIAIVLLQAVTVLDEVFQYHSPLVTSTRSYNRLPGDLGLNSSNFVFAFKVNDPFYDLSQSYVSYELMGRAITRSPNGSVSFSTTKIPLKKCDIEYFNGFEAEFVALKLNGALCPNTDTYNISGNFLSDYFAFLEFFVKPCQNSTDSPDVICQPIENIRDYMNTSFRLQMYFTNTLLTPGNHSTPVSRYIDEVYWDIAPNVSHVKTDIMLNEQVVLSDDFIWLAGYNMRNESTYQIDLAELRTGYTKLVPGADPDDFTILQGNIKRSSYVTTTKREYSTISTGLSAIGGIFSFIFGVFGVLIATYTRRKFLVSVANEMYDFQLPEYLKQKKKKKSQCCGCLRKKKNKPQSTEDLSNSMKLNSTDSYHERYERVAQYYKKENAKEQNKLSFGFLDFLVSIVSCCRREKDRFVQRAVETVTRDMDILHLIQNSHENERLKNVLLTTEQQDLFSHACRPVIVTKDLWKKPAPMNRTLTHSPMIEQGSPVSKQSSPKYESTQEDPPSPKNKAEKREREYRQFLALCKSYQKLFRESKDPTNLKILELLDANLHETLYEMNQVFKDVRVSRARLGSTVRPGNKTVMMVQKTKIHSKLEAARKIATSIQKKFREKKKNKLKISERTTSEIQLFKPEEKQNDESPITNQDVGIQLTSSPQFIQQDEPSASYGDIPVDQFELTQPNEFPKYNIVVSKNKKDIELKPWT